MGCYAFNLDLDAKEKKHEKNLKKLWIIQDWNWYYKFINIAYCPKKSSDLLLFRTKRFAFNFIKTNSGFLCYGNTEEKQYRGKEIMSGERHVDDLVKVAVS